MQGLLIDNNDKFDITIYVGKDKDEQIFADSDKESLIELDEIDAKDVQNVIFTFRSPAYRDEVNLLKNAVISDGMNVSFDPSTVRYQRFKNLLVGWSLKDSKGKTIPVSESNIGKLHPRLAGAVLAALDNKLS